MIYIQLLLVNRQSSQKVKENNSDPTHIFTLEYRKISLNLRAKKCVKKPNYAKKKLHLI